MDVVIRKGRKEDLLSLLELIRELAEYEKAPNEVTNTIYDMERDGFGDRPVFGFYVAVYDEKIVGAAIFFYKYSTWKGKCIYLEDLIVSESYRRQGIGTLLFEQMIRLCREEDAKRFEWQVLDWNFPAINFYKKYAAHFDSGWINGKLTEEQIQAYSNK